MVELIRANYVGSFYLPEHQPMPCVYKSHYQSRIPSHCNLLGYCNCGREKGGDDFCKICWDSINIVECAKARKISREIEIILNSCPCEVCGKHFADNSILHTHLAAHSSDVDLTTCNQKNPKQTSVAELKNELRKLNMSINGNKPILIQRLESKLASGC